ncbi:MAG: DUF1156 domain-containing protein, partial [Acidovorax sp.]|nr:DUF1156 domain-containing protein [Acidovorax sp.]
MNASAGWHTPSRYCSKPPTTSKTFCKQRPTATCWPLPCKPTITRFLSPMSPIRTPKKLIEVALPLDDINAASAREKSIRHGHPSTLHLW